MDVNVSDLVFIHVPRWTGLSEGGGERKKVVGCDERMVSTINRKNHVCVAGFYLHFVALFKVKVTNDLEPYYRTLLCTECHRNVPFKGSTLPCKRMTIYGRLYGVHRQNISFG